MPETEQLFVTENLKANQRHSSAHEGAAKHYMREGACARAQLPAQTAGAAGQGGGGGARSAQMCPNALPRSPAWRPWRCQRTPFRPPMVCCTARAACHLRREQDRLREGGGRASIVCALGARCLSSSATTAKSHMMMASLTANQ